MAMNNEKTFEEGMEALEGLVKRMEQGDLPLEQSFEAYEQAKNLLKKLSDMLDAGEARMTELTEQGEAPLETES